MIMCNLYYSASQAWFGISCQPASKYSFTKPSFHNLLIGNPGRLSTLTSSSTPLIINGYKTKNFLLQKSTYSCGNLFEYVFHKFFDCIGIQLGAQKFQCQWSQIGSLALNTEGKRSTFLI